MLGLIENPSSNNHEGNSEVPQFLVNLNELASKGELDPVIGRGRRQLQKRPPTVKAEAKTGIIHRCR